MICTQLLTVRSTRAVVTALLFIIVGYRNAANNNEPVEKTSHIQHFTAPFKFNKEQAKAAAKTVSGNGTKVELVHRSLFGLGHRLSRMSAAWHFTKSLNITRLKIGWENCAGKSSTQENPEDIFPYLFGGDAIDVPGSIMDPSITREKVLAAKNDIAGYYAGQNLKDHRVPFPTAMYQVDDSPFLAKLESDLELYNILSRRFVGRDDVQTFLDRHHYEDHFVIGVHLRFGNDNTEGGDFERAGRQVDNLDEFVSNLLDLIGTTFLESLSKSHPERFTMNGEQKKQKKKSPLLFLATDSPSWIANITDHMRSNYGVDTIIIPQYRPESGVTFQEWRVEEERCIQGWYEMLLDNFVLANSDVLIAARYSTFSQILPMRLVFDKGRNKKGPHFCEVSGTAKTMTCLEDIRTWVFRDDASKMFTYTLDSDVNEGEVVHKVMVQFPDLDFSKSKELLGAQQYLNSGRRRFRIMPYGKNPNQKYRGDNPECYPQCNVFNFI